MLYDVDETIEWKDNLTATEWNAVLAQASGHPLQSTQWGDAKELCYGINDYRWIAYKDALPVLMARFEERKIANLLKIAWVPKGPIILDKTIDKYLYKAFLFRLKKKGFLLCAMNPYEKINFPKKSSAAFYTIWLNLSLSKESLWRKLSKQCRYDINRANKLGVVIEKSNSLADFEEFYQSYIAIGKSKKFNITDSRKFISSLLFNKECTNVDTHLFVAKHDGNICGGAIIIRCGRNIHYLWGAVNRNFSRLCIGESLQWGVIEWALENNYQKYDLEGISSSHNSSTDKFKKKFGGDIVAYPSINVYPLCFGKTIILCFMKLYFYLQPKITKYKVYFSEFLSLVSRS